VTGPLRQVVEGVERLPDLARFGWKGASAESPCRSAGLTESRFLNGRSGPQPRGFTDTLPRSVWVRAVFPSPPHGENGEGARSPTELLVRSSSSCRDRAKGRSQKLAGLPSSRTCFSVTRFCATAALTLETARGATSLSTPDVASRPT
jgi:hypothetical protein